MGDMEGLALLGNLLSLPSDMDAQAIRAQQERQLVQSAFPQLEHTNPGMIEGLTPQSARFPGMQTPILGGILRGVGTAGHVIQALSGASPAPRGDRLSGITRFLDTQQKMGLNAARETLAGDLEARQPRERLSADAVRAGATAEGLRFYGAGDVTKPFALWRKDNPEGSYRDWQRQQVEGAAQKHEAVTAGAGGSVGPGGKPKTEFQLYESDPAAWEELQRKKGQFAVDKAGSLAEVKEKWVKLPPAQRTVWSQADQMKGAIAKMRQALSDPAVLADRGVFEGRLRQGAYLAGFSQGEGEDAYIALANITKILGAQPFMRGTRNFQYVKQIQDHLPRPGDEPALVLDKLSQIGGYLEDMQGAILDAETPVRTLREQRGVGGGGVGSERPAASAAPTVDQPAVNAGVAQGASIRELADSLANEVNAGKMTPEQAHEVLKKAASGAGQR